MNKQASIYSHEQAELDALPNDMKALEKLLFNECSGEVKLSNITIDGLCIIQNISELMRYASLFQDREDHLFKAIDIGAYIIGVITDDLEMQRKLRQVVKRKMKMLSVA